MDVYDEIRAERARQVTLWGVQNHSPHQWLAILTEEVGEVSKEVADARVGEFDMANYRVELIQTAAVAVAAVEALDRLEEARDRQKGPIPFVSTFTLEERRNAWLHNHAGEPFPADLA